MTNSSHNQNVEQLNKFIENNLTFLQGKYQQHFSKVNLNFKELKNQTVIDYIYDVFGLRKYQKQQQKNKSLHNSLLLNYQSFVKDLKGNKKTNIQFSNDVAVKLLRYCITNNTLFAVQYQKKEMTNAVNDQQQSHDPIQQKDQQKDQQKKSQSENNSVKNESKIEEEAQKSQNNQKTQRKQLQDKHLNENEFSIHSDGKQKQTILNQLVKKKIKILFEFYCKQLHGTGVSKTFDLISHECSAINLGKFIVFCHATDIFNAESKLTKIVCIRQFKRISGGRKQIEFQTFHELIASLARIDQQLIQRLGINDANKFKTKKRLLSVPFNTKDQSIREVKVYDKVLIKKPIIPSSKLKSKEEQAIHQQTQEDRQVGSSKVGHHRMDHTYSQQKMINASKKFNEKNTQRSSNIKKQEQADLGFLKKLIQPQQETDDIFLNDYKLPKNFSRIQSKPNHPNQIYYKTPNTRYQTHKMRNQILVSNLKNRVKQVQKDQKSKQRNQNVRVSRSAVKK